jgi:hypothetical protein
VERTVLAWTRSWLAVGGCALLLLRISIGSAPRLAAALALGALALVLATLAGQRRATRLRALAAAPGPLDPPVLPAAVMAASVSLLGLAAAVLVATR